MATMNPLTQEDLIQQQHDKIAELERERDAYAAMFHVAWFGGKPSCQECNGPHILDTSLPSDVWDKIAEPHEYLCALCIDQRLKKAGLTCNQTEFYFVGEALCSKLYHESHGDIAKLTRDLETAREQHENDLSDLRSDWRIFADALIHVSGRAHAPDPNCKRCINVQTAMTLALHPERAE